MNQIIKSLLFVLVLLIIGGCSGNTSDPVTSSTDESSGTPLTGVPNDTSSHELWTSGTINIDPETMTAEVVPDRNTEAHYEVGGYLPMSVVVNSIDPVEWIVDVDVTFLNDSPFAGFDLRLIIMATSIGQRLLNADDWTPLFDDTSDGLPVNPFKAYAKAEPSREFLPGLEHTENLLISIPGGSYSIPYAIDASYPRNCEEPYEINNFMHGELLETPGAMALAELDVLSWNDDVNMVELYLPAVTGVALVPFTLDAGNHWMMDLTNTAGAPAGEYVGYVKATTLGSGTLALIDEVMVTVTEEAVTEYVGSERCGVCHRSTFEKWYQMGHAYKLQKMDGVNPPTLPFTTIVSEPPGYTWAEIPYFLGGFAWKANFLDPNGYVATGEFAHYMVDSGEWHEYDLEDPPGTKAYTCSRCHTTGWEETGEMGPHQDGLPGIYATWAEAGIGCERCHGPGSDHVESPNAGNINIDPSSDLCGDCHSSGAMETVRTQGDGLVRDHVQRNEMFNSPHEGSLTCNTCHDVHSSTFYDAQAPGNGVKILCTQCHQGGAHQVTGPMGTLRCTDCHMPKAAVSAHAKGEGLHLEGDVHSHILRIDTSGVPLEEYYEEVGGRTVIKRIDGEIKLNLAWACMSCHDGDEASLIESYALAAARADGIHTMGAEPTYEGAEVCGACHTAKYEMWSEMGHAYKLQKMDGVNPPSLPFTTIASEPPGYTWAEIPYFLGGYAWKANFLDSNGYMGTGEFAHYYVDSGEWHEYDIEDPPGTAPYTCSRCHTTGWVETGEMGPHQDGLPGIYATWAEEGIACERCHGPGSNHVDSPRPDTITIDSSSDLCGDCHSSGDLETIRVVESGLVRDHVQRNELFNSPHAFFTCNTCHDSHASTYYDDVALGDGVTAACTDCHAELEHQVSGSMSILACTDCHMPLAAVSAHETGEGVHMRGDVHTHMFRIDTTGVMLEDYYEEVGGRTVIKDIDGEKRINLAWACMICHDGIDAFPIDNYGMAAGFAAGIHE